MELIPEDVLVPFPQDLACFGCSQGLNPHSLGLTFRRRGDTIGGAPTLGAHLTGAPGIAHGGIVSLLLDEYSCAAAFFLRGSIVVTGELKVRYSAPCPVERELYVVARIVDESHLRYRIIEAEVRLGEELLARSTGKFFPSPPDRHVLPT